MNLKESLSYALDQLQLFGADKAEGLISESEKKELNIESGKMSLFRTTFQSALNLSAIKDDKSSSISINKIDKDSNPYPRHFGVTFYGESDFNEMVERLEKNNVDFIQPVNTRFEGKPEVHRTLFFRDPSNNVLEFKYYPNSDMMY